MSDTPWVVEASGYINKRKGFLKTYDMELYHLICSFPNLTLVKVAIDNVCQVIEVDDII